MPFNPEYHHRRSIRLQGYDYSQNGAYFLTSCIQNRAYLLGEVVEDTINLNAAGQMIEKWWQEMGKRFPSLEIDEYVVMPNHFHGIVVITTTDPHIYPNSAGAHAGAPLQMPSIGKIVQWFKTMTTNDYIRGVKENRWQPFQGRLWQRNYYEHVIRNESGLNDIRSYIQSNSLRWGEDKENPANINLGMGIYQ